MRTTQLQKATSSHRIGVLIFCPLISLCRSPELVQAINAKFRQLRMNVACNSNSNVAFFVSCRPPRTVEEGNIASFFYGDLGLALASKMCPDQSQAFQKVRHLPSEEKRMVHIFSGGAASRCSMIVQMCKVSRRISKN